MAFSKTFVFVNLPGTKWSFINCMTINAFLSEKKKTHYVLRSIGAETFIFLSGEGVP